MLNIHVYPSPLTHESRILRITDALAEAGIFNEIEVIGIAREDLPAHQTLDAHRKFVRLPRKLCANSEGFFAKLVRTVEWSVRVLISLHGRKVACINAHSLAVLPLCVLASWVTGAKLVYDTHELETETSGAKGVRQKLSRTVERLLIGRTDKVFVVSPSIADWYVKTYVIERPVVVCNIPQFLSQASLDVDQMRARMGLRVGIVTFIYQGGLIPGRGVERLLKVFSNSPDLDLVCMGSGPLQELVAQVSVEHQNIHLISSVAPHEVLAYSRLADVGLCLTENCCLSYYYSLPNKLFEYLHAGLPILVSPLLEQQQLVRQYECGWVVPEDDQEFVNLLRSIDHTAITQRLKGVEAASRVFNWDDEKARLIRAYKDFFFV